MAELSTAAQLPLQKGHVLVVDDEESIVRSVEALLDGEFAVRTANSVRDALAIIDAETIDVLVSDFQMLDGTGEEVIRRASAAHRGAFTILLTGHVDHPRVVALGQTGSTLVLRKPIDPDVLIDWVRHGLALARLSAATRLTPPAVVGQ